MEQQQYKIYAYLPDKSCEVRRFCIDKCMVNSYHYINAKLQNVYPVLIQRKYTVNWKDEDDDDIVITSDEELQIAMQNLLGQNIIKLYVCVGPEKERDAVNAAYPDMECGREVGSQHFGVICDECDREVVGFRYKCTTCQDYDLCARCEGAGAHAHHCMLRIPHSPQVAFKEVLKRTRHLLKNFNGKEEGPQGHKKHRRDRSAEKKSKEHHRRERRECRRPRGAGWLETVTAYMNEFVNLAGDIDLNAPEGESRRHAQTNTGPEPTAPGAAAAAPAAAAPAAATERQAASEDAEMPQAEPAPGPSAAASPRPIGFVASPPRLTPEMQRFLDQVDSMWAHMFDVKFTDMFVHRNGEDGFAQRESDASGSGDGPGVGRRTPPPDSRASSVSANEKGDGDKVDDWTLLNNELMDEVAKTAPTTPTAPAAPAAPATPAAPYDLPQQFTQRVYIDRMYPPLNVNTAVLNPEAPEFPQPAGAGAAGGEKTPPPTAAPKPKTPPSVRKIKPHIAAALSSMLAMGFNNDGGWITQLLEDYDGNIAAVLDLLTPVHAKKK